VPSTYRPGTPVPLLVALPGCTETGAAFERLTGLSALAERRGFIVVYPEQSALANPSLCWNWFPDVNQVRGSGEPSLIAGITAAVRVRYAVDARRVFVTGGSAGGVMAVVMAATYPDVFAAAGVVAGCEYRCDVLRLRPPDKAGTLAYRAMGPARPPGTGDGLPGSADPVVPPQTAARLVGRWAQTDDLALNGTDDGDMDAVPDEVGTGQVPRGRAFVRSAYASASGSVLIEEYLVEGAGHGWPGGCACDPFGDPAGPDASTWVCTCGGASRSRLTSIAPVIGLVLAPARPNSTVAGTRPGTTGTSASGMATPTRLSMTARSGWPVASGRCA
jgi:poly(hydroxyalkanoate) depolymerase family esterase